MTEAEQLAKQIRMKMCARLGQSYPLSSRSQHAKMMQALIDVVAEELAIIKAGGSKK